MILLFHIQLLDSKSDPHVSYLTLHVVTNELYVSFSSTDC